jgi:hypothetical protein
MQSPFSAGNREIITQRLLFLKGLFRKIFLLGIINVYPGEICQGKRSGDDGHGYLSRLFILFNFPFNITVLHVAWCAWCSLKKCLNLQSILHFWLEVYFFLFKLECYRSWIVLSHREEDAKNFNYIFTSISHLTMLICLYEPACM